MMTKQAESVYKSARMAMDEASRTRFDAFVNAAFAIRGKDPAKYASVSDVDLIEVLADKALSSTKSVRTTQELQLKEAEAAMLYAATIGMQAIGVDADIVQNVVKTAELCDELGSIAGLGFNMKLAMDNTFYMQGLEKLASMKGITVEQAAEFIESLDDESAFVAGFRIAQV